MNEIYEIDKLTDFRLFKLRSVVTLLSVIVKYQKNNIVTISSLIELQIYGILCQIIWYWHLQSTALKHHLIAG